MIDAARLRFGNPRRRFGFALVALLGSLVLPALLVADPPAQAEDPLSQMGWIAGTWKGDLGGETFWTQYTPPDGGLILSLSKTLAPDGRATFFEFERWTSQDGSVTMTPYPGGQQSVDFKLQGWDAKVKKAVFANPQHDFPQTLAYELVAEDNLVIQLEGVEGGKPAKLRFDLRRVK